LAICAYIDAALGNVKADLVIKDANTVNVITREIYVSDIAIKGDRIVLVGDSSDLIGPHTSIINASDLYAIPGFVDAHLHVESSMLTPTEFCRIVGKHGTTALLWDPHEIVNVAGIEALKVAIEETMKIPIHVYFVVPSCVPSSPGNETSGAHLSVALVAKALKLERVIGLGEVMDYPGVLSCSPEVIKKIEFAKRMRMLIDGHAPGLRGKELSAYVTSGIRSDHESVSEEEGVEKLRAGMWLMIRESSTSKDLCNLVKPLVRGKLDSRHCMFVSDDRSVNDLLLEGHMDHILRKAISEGLDFMTATQMVSINPATYMGIDDEVGSLTAGRFADIILLSDLEKIRIEKVVIGGRELRARPAYKRFRYPGKLTRTIKLKRKLGPCDFTYESASEKVRVNAIRITEGTLLTSKDVRWLKTSQGVVEASSDVLYASVVERHRRTGNVGKGFVTGLGSFEGALAQTIAHDAHNMIVVGSNPLDMSISANAVSVMQGGIALSSNEKLVASLALNIAGLISTDSAEEVAKKKEMLEVQCRNFGFQLKSPVTALSFLSLPVIPALRLTDKGLFDVQLGAFIDPILR
jgi:adenine deaminase